MQRRGNALPVFIFLLVLSLMIFFLSQKGFLNGVTGLFEQATLPLRKMSFSVLHNSKQKLSPEEILKKENKQLLMQLANEKEIENENKALRDQFETTDISPKKLIPAEIVGLVSFIPGDTALDEIVINKGKSDGALIGNTVVFKNNLVGKVIKSSQHIAVVELVIHKDISLTAKTLRTSALGIIKGSGEDGVIFDNVLLSDSLKKNDLVLTKGDSDASGKGFPPDLVVGKIISVNKKTSALFQSAEVESLVDFSKLDMVFVMAGN